MHRLGAAMQRENTTAEGDDLYIHLLFTLCLASRPK